MEAHSVSNIGLYDWLRGNFSSSLGRDLIEDCSSAAYVFARAGDGSLAEENRFLENAFLWTSTDASIACLCSWRDL